MAIATDNLFRLQLEGFGLLLLCVLYRLPDHPLILQEFIHQMPDMAPDLPRLKQFLNHWETKLDGPIVEVRYSMKVEVGPQEVRMAAAEFRLN